MNIEERHLRIVETILDKYPYAFYAFGSRVRGNNTQFSDLDICFFDNIPNSIRLQIEEEFEESDLPYKIDLVYWHNCDLDSQVLISKHMACLQERPIR